MKILKSILNYIPLATFIIFVVTDGIFSLTSALIFVISTIGLLINWKRKKQRWRIEKIPVCRIKKIGIQQDKFFLQEHLWWKCSYLHLPWPGRDKNISGFLFDAGSAEVFCTILHWCFPGLFPENRCEITLTGKRQGRRNYRDRIIGMAKHILSGLYFFILYIGTDRNSHLFCEQVT